MESQMAVSYALCFTLQRYKIESNSQRSNDGCTSEASCVSHCKDTKLKAIHNQRIDMERFVLLCFTLQRYKIESNSQLQRERPKGQYGCVSHCKDTKLKAIHNVEIGVRFRGKLCFTLQRYKIESNSQRQHSLFFYSFVVFHTAKIQN